ncbi:phage tail protein [Pedobacter agri]|uniref:phage tail protein n=1 Tax=Pedobacter agri TaxID=454586 RepID=UPI000E286E2A|nr:tail fiber protein [Pedobacter agri]MDQ1142633.1 microcystin-dependent protein [Pedobacter agri]
MDVYLGFIAAFGYTFAPRGWMLCQGQTLPISQNTALFSLLGTTYGGNGQTTFALPDLRGRTLVGMGQGPGLSNYVQGQIAGVENTTLLIGNMPAHNHTGTLNPIADNSVGNSSSPVGNRLANSPKTGSGPNASTLNTYTSATATPVSMSAQSVIIGPNGGNQPFSIMQPYLAINYSIAVQGLFPSRN